jgi:protein SCO1/2
MKMENMCQKKWINWLLILGMSLASCGKSANTGLPYYGDADLTPHWPKNGKIGKGFHQIGDFKFTNQNNEVLDQSIFQEKVTVVNFFFSRCPGICPTLMGNLDTIGRTYADDERVNILSHSVTPDADSVPVLQAYHRAKRITKSNWHLLTGPKKDLYSAARKYYFADEDLGKQTAENDFLHTENIYLIDGHGYIRGVYKGTFPVEINHLVEDIEVLLNE